VSTNYTLDILKYRNKIAQTIHVLEFSVDYNIEIASDCISHPNAFDLGCSSCDLPEFSRLRINEDICSLQVYSIPYLGMLSPILPNEEGIREYKI